MGTSVYYALRGAKGYINIEIAGVKRLVFIEPNNIESLDFSGMKPFEIDEVEIELVLVEDLKLHQSSDGKEGSMVGVYKLKNLGDFERYEIR